MGRPAPPARTAARNLRQVGMLPVLGWLCIPSAALSQTTDKQFEVVYTPAAPVLDGHLDDDVWDAAPVIDDMHEVDPIEFAPAKEQVRVQVLYDANNLYVAVDVIVQDVGDITAFRLAQGTDIQQEDRFKVVIDPYNNQRSGYDFRINPNGVREEGLYGLLDRPNTDWNGIWDGGAQFTDTGWSAEMAIPFKTLNFDPDNTTWGISFSLNVSGRNEQIAWTSQNRVVRPGTLGLMTGVDRAEQGHGLDIVPSLSIRQTRNFASGFEDFRAEPSVDVFYKLTPELTAAVTVNTDFSAAEVDDRVVNLDRFPVFFPEKRSFFLQDADIFSFANLNNNGIPFFSRRIGLNNEREPVDLLGGLKLTGRVGRANVGVLGVVQEAGPDNVNLFVGRSFFNILNLSTLGLIYTNGSPEADVENSVLGVDFNYINREMFGGKGLTASTWFLQSDSPGVSSSDEAYGFSVDTSRSEGLFAELRHERLGDNYIPALGFVNRAGIRETEFEIGYRILPENGRYQSYLASVEVSDITNLDGATESQYITFEPLGLVGNADDRFDLYLYREREVLTSPFEIYDGVVIDIGDYSWNTAAVNIGSGDQRKVAGSVYIADGDFYGGKRRNFYADMTWQPSKHFSLRGAIDFNDIELPGGAFITRLLSMRADVAFSSKWSWTTLAQYDNESDELSVNSRLRWIRHAGQEVIFVVNHGFLVDDRSTDARRNWRSLESDIVLKINYTFRY